MVKVGFAVVAVLALLVQDVDNPEYQNWSKGKAGSFVSSKMVSDFGGNKSEMEMTTTLKEISADKAVVETKTSMVVGGNKMDLPAQSRDVPAKIKKVEGKEGEKPKEGDEEIEVAGKKLKCHWVETTTDANGNKTTAKVWTTKEIPGGMAKMESTTEGAQKGSTSMVVTAFEWK